VFYCELMKIMLLLLFLTFRLAFAEGIDMDCASNSSMYKMFATYYDHFYESKDYNRETAFIDALFSKFQVKTILGVGCGTGTHLSKLEEYGYFCEGIDFNQEMVEIANTKLKGTVFQADMRQFALDKRYDAVLSLFAVFNHNLDIDDARKTLSMMKNHLKEGGVLVLDLYNPQYSGEKTNTYKGITKIMQWQLNSEEQVCESTIIFLHGDEKVCEEQFPLKIYSITLMKQLLKEAGFTSIQVYDNYTFEEATMTAKNLVFVAL